MSVATRARSLVLVPLTLAACASAPPPAVELGHPAHLDTAAAPPATLTILGTYHDFGVPGVSPEPAQPGASPTPEREKSDAHHH